MTVIGALPVELRRIVRHREEDLQQLAVGDLGRVVDNLHALGVPGVAAHRRVVASRFGADPPA